MAGASVHLLDAGGDVVGKALHMHGCICRLRFLLATMIIAFGLRIQDKQSDFFAPVVWISRDIDVCVFSSGCR